MIESLNPLMTQVVEPLRDGLLSFGTVGMLVWTVLKILAIAMPVIISVAFYVVWERKLIGWMHVRRGPMYVGWGVLQAFADVFKLLFKEVLRPQAANKALFYLAPLLALVPAFAAWSVIPFDAGVALARDMIELSGLTPDKDITIEYTGIRPGEKLYEELLMDEEGLRQTDPARR